MSNKGNELGVEEEGYRVEIPKVRGGRELEYF